MLRFRFTSVKIFKLRCCSRNKSDDRVKGQTYIFVA